MFLAFYNKENVGDTLLLVQKETSEAVDFERLGNVSRIFIKQTNETLAYNIFEVSSLFEINGNGLVLLNNEQVSIINSQLAQYNFEPIRVDNSPKFVIGYVDTCVPHSDSDHLSITTVLVGENASLQIVCGAANVAAGQLVVVAKHGAVMPNGQLIFSGELRGEISNGMLCSAKELGLQHEGKKGILVLESGEIGSAFSFDK